MPIHDQSYRHWEGTFKPHTFRWWVITREGLKIILRHKMFLLFIMAPPTISFLVFGTIIYGVNAYGKLFNLDIINPSFFYRFFMQQTFFIAVICIFGGSGLIANDLKNNALQLYLSKPLTRLDYLAGKLAIVMALMGMVTIAPGIILFIENALLSEGLTYFKENLWLLGAIILFSFIIMLTTGFLVLALSSITKNNRYAAISFAVILIGTPIFSGILTEALGIKSGAFISYWSNLDILGRELFGMPSRHHWYWPTLIVLIIIGLCAWIMNRRVKGVEIIK